MKDNTILIVKASILLAAGCLGWFGMAAIDRHYNRSASHPPLAQTQTQQEPAWPGAATAWHRAFEEELKDQAILFGQREQLKDEIAAKDAQIAALKKENARPRKHGTKEPDSISPGVVRRCYFRTAERHKLLPGETWAVQVPFCGLEWPEKADQSAPPKEQPSKANTSLFPENVNPCGDTLEPTTAAVMPNSVAAGEQHCRLVTDGQGPDDCTHGGGHWMNVCVWMSDRWIAGAPGTSKGQP